MALIKSQNADPGHEAIVLDLGDLRRQAASMRETAQLQAQRIIADARVEAKRIMDGASQQGYDAGFAAGHGAGAEAGRLSGHAEALQHTAHSLQQLQQAWIAAAQKWDEQRGQMLIEARQSLLDLSMAIARKIVRRVPQIDPSIVVDQVAEAIRHVTRPCAVTITINPADKPLVEAAMPGLVQQFTATQHVTLAEDPAIAPGGCIVAYGRGRIDATLDVQLDRLVQSLLPESQENTDNPGA